MIYTNYVNMLLLEADSDNIKEFVNISKRTGCWNWTGAVDDDGYGITRIDNGKTTRAHIASFKIYKGSVPDGQIVMHKCDNPRCVNPAHLKIGTQKENMQDMVKKNRENNGK